MAPEILHLFEYDDDESTSSGDDKRPSYTNSVDIWAIGVILFQLLTGWFPFPSHSNKLAKYVRDKAAFPVERLQSERVSAPACEVVQSFLAPRPSSRPSAESSLQHSWLKSPDLQVDLSMRLPDNPSGSSGSASWNTEVARSQDVTGLRSLFQKMTLKKRGPIQGSDTIRKIKQDRPAVPSSSSLNGDSLSLRRRQSVTFKDFGLREVEFSPSEGILAVIGTPKTRLLHVPTLQEALMIDSDSGFKEHSAFSPDGTQFASISEDSRSIRLTDLATGATIRTLQLPPEYQQFDPNTYSGLKVVKFLSNERLTAMYAINESHKVIIWSTKTGALISSSLSIPMSTAHAFSPDGRLIFGTSNSKPFSGFSVLWDTTTGQEVQKLRYSAHPF